MIVQINLPAKTFKTIQATQTLNLGTAFSYTIPQDAFIYASLYSLTGNPTAMTIDSGTRVLAITQANSRDRTKFGGGASDLCTKNFTVSIKAQNPNNGSDTGVT